MNMPCCTIDLNAYALACPQAASTGAQMRRTLRELAPAEAPTHAYAPAPATNEVQDAVPGSALFGTGLRPPSPSPPIGNITTCCDHTATWNDAKFCLTEHNCQKIDVFANETYTLDLLIVMCQDCGKNVAKCLNSQFQCPPQNGNV